MEEWIVPPAVGYIEAISPNENTINIVPTNVMILDKRYSQLLGRREPAGDRDQNLLVVKQARRSTTGKSRGND
jgi:hypothetical protein